jgi:hypothetical protein
MAVVVMVAVDNLRLFVVLVVTAVADVVIVVAVPIVAAEVVIRLQL